MTSIHLSQLTPCFLRKLFPMTIFITQHYWTSKWFPVEPPHEQAFQMLILSHRNLSLGRNNKNTKHYCWKLLGTILSKTCTHKEHTTRRAPKKSIHKPNMEEHKNVHKYLQRKTNALSVCPLKHLLESFIVIFPKLFLIRHSLRVEFSMQQHPEHHKSQNNREKETN